jgi:small subunit ribosomal protein S4
VKVVNKLGTLPCFSNKKSERNRFYNQNAKPFQLQLRERQKLKYNYSLSELELKKYIKKAKKLQCETESGLLELIEMRLDSIVYRLNICESIQQARQFVSHGHIFVNKKRITIPSYICKVKDKINGSRFINKRFDTLNSKNRKRPFTLRLKGSSKHLRVRFNLGSQYGVIADNARRQDIDLDVNILPIIEYYSNLS